MLQLTSTLLILIQLNSVFAISSQSIKYMAVFCRTKSVKTNSNEWENCAFHLISHGHYPDFFSPHFAIVSEVNRAIYIYFRMEGSLPNLKHIPAVLLF